MSNIHIQRGFTSVENDSSPFDTTSKGPAEARLNMHLENNQWKVGKMELKHKEGRETFY